VSTPANSFQLRSATQANRALVLKLTRQTDRFVSMVQMVHSGQATAILRSVEGDGNKSWPPSPVIQNLMKYQTPSGVSLVGLGMAGKSHWSVAIGTLPDEPAIELDFACLVKQRPEWVGSTYCILNADSRHESNNAVVFQVGQAVVRCETFPANGECHIANESGRLSFVPSLEPAHQLPQTIRWKYRFSVVSGRTTK